MIDKGFRGTLLTAIVMAALVIGLGCQAGAQTQAPAGTPAATASGTKGGTFTIFGDDPPTLDPALSGDATSATYVVEVFGGLVTLNKELQVVPDIAESWKVSPNGLIYTFTLRKGVKFHNGKEVTAQDFKYSIERAADPATKSPTAETYLGDILGVKDKLDGKTQEVKGIKVVDPSTLEITIDAAKAYFIAKLTYPTAFVMDKDNVEKDGKPVPDWWKNPNGTGPFKLTEFKQGERIVLERNLNYYLEPAKLDKVVFLLAGGSAMTMYENNEVDVTGVSINDIDRVKDPSNTLNKQLLEAPELSVSYIGLNTKQPPFDDPKVRQAFNLALDRNLIIKSVLKDIVQRADGVLPPGLPGYNSNLQGLSFDPAKAKQLLQQSKYGSPEGLPPVRITIGVQAVGASNPPTVEAMVEMWKQNLGAKVEIQQLEWAIFLTETDKKSLQMFSVGWIADYPDPQDFLEVLFYSKSFQNSTQYSNPQVDQKLEQARVEQNVQQRLKLYQDAEQIIVQDAPWIPLWYGKNIILVKPNVKGFEPPAMVIPTLRYISKGA